MEPVTLQELLDVKAAGDSCYKQYVSFEEWIDEQNNPTTVTGIILKRLSESMKKKLDEEFSQ